MNGPEAGYHSWLRENTETQTYQHFVMFGLVMGQEKKNITRLILQHNQLKT